jgi:hypothetical protein
VFPDTIDWSYPADFFHWLADLRQKLIRRYSHIDVHLLDESIEDAVLHYSDHPKNFDASRGVPLSYYLWLRTRHYLDKRLQKVKCRRYHERAVGVSEKNLEKIVSAMRGRRSIYVGKDATERDTEEQRADSEWRRQALDAIVATLDPHDRAGVELLHTGVSCEAWVRHLGIQRLPRNMQQQKVKAEKDRLKKKMRRRAEQMQRGMFCNGLRGAFLNF